MHKLFTRLFTASQPNNQSKQSPRFVCFESERTRNLSNIIFQPSEHLPHLYSVTRSLKTKSSLLNSNLYKNTTTITFYILPPASWSNNSPSSQPAALARQCVIREASYIGSSTCQSSIITLLTGVLAPKANFIYTYGYSV